jgi:hypothetical protein
MHDMPAKYTGNDLLNDASGKELLMLMSMSNEAMRGHIRRELDTRAALAAVSSHLRCIRPLAMRPLVMGRAA